MKAGINFMVDRLQISLKVLLEDEILSCYFVKGTQYNFSFFLLRLLLKRRATAKPNLNKTEVMMS
jgi:hypothetical protein